MFSGLIGGTIQKPAILKHTNKNNMTNQANKPLYKVLNEQRTQGEITVENHGQFSNGRSLIVGGKCIISTFGQNASESEIEANAQYTALAVNNLASLAEALESLCDSYYKGDLIPNMERKFQKAKEALNRIK